MVFTDAPGILSFLLSEEQIMRNVGSVWQQFSPSPLPESGSAPRPRLCVLKQGDKETYGFNLRLESGCRGHVIRNVVLGGVAQRSGLQDGDRLLEVNNCYVDDVPHPEVTPLNPTGPWWLLRDSTDYHRHQILYCSLIPAWIKFYTQHHNQLWDLIQKDVTLFKPGLNLPQVDYDAEST
uniref:PDZ domain containing 3b n=1 Tax=Nothobranchius rachovii TaxID=451742 RepID=A0A1A8NPT8_9TELE